MVEFDIRVGNAVAGNMAYASISFIKSPPVPWGPLRAFSENFINADLGWGEFVESAVLTSGSECAVFISSYILWKPELYGCGSFWSDGSNPEIIEA